MFLRSCLFYKQNAVYINIQCDICVTNSICIIMRLHKFESNVNKQVHIEHGAAYYKAKQPLQNHTVQADALKSYSFRWCTLSFRKCTRVYSAVGDVFWLGAEVRSESVQVDVVWLVVDCLKSFGAHNDENTSRNMVFSTLLAYIRFSHPTRISKPHI